MLNSEYNGLNWDNTGRTAGLKALKGYKRVQLKIVKIVLQFKFHIKRVLIGLIKMQK